MATGAAWPNLALNNWNGTDYVKRIEFNDNFQKIDNEFHATTGHGHTGAAGDGPKIAAAGLANGAAADLIIGNRNITDTTAQTAGASSTLTTLLGQLGNMIKGITGKANWYTAPAITLETAAAYLNQGVKTTDSPTFVWLTLSHATNPKIVSPNNAYFDIIASNAGGAIRLQAGKSDMTNPALMIGNLGEITLGGRLTMSVPAGNDQWSRPIWLMGTSAAGVTKGMYLQTTNTGNLQIGNNDTQGVLFINQDKSITTYSGNILSDVNGKSEFNGNMNMRGMENWTNDGWRKPITVGRGGLASAIHFPIVGAGGTLAMGIGRTTNNSLYFITSTADDGTAPSFYPFIFDMANKVLYINGNNAAWHDGSRDARAAARAAQTQGAGQSIVGNTATRITFETKDYDNLNNFGSSQFTAPQAGIYLVTALVSFNSSGISTPNRVILDLYKNGASQQRLDDRITGQARLGAAGGATTIRLNAGENIDFYLYSENTVSLITGTNATYVTIVRIA